MLNFQSRPASRNHRVLATATLIAVTFAANPAAAATVAITEWMYSGNGGEFIEFTNLTAGPVSLSGWVYDDDSRITTVAGGAFSLSALGTLAPGESAIITESTEADFRTHWGLGATVKVLGGYTNNIGRNDEINVYDGDGTLIDRLAYGDQVYPGSIRTQNASGNPVNLAVLDSNDVTGGLVGSPAWVLAISGDSYGSYASTLGDIGNPGSFSVVPVPAALPLLLGALGALAAVRRRA